MNIREIKNLSDLDATEITTFREAIRLKCYDCCAYDYAEIAKCKSFSCPLWLFRDGHRKSKDVSRVEAVKAAKDEYRRNINS